MNTSQLNSLIRKALFLFGAWLIQHGSSHSATLVGAINTPDVLGSLATAVSLIWSHVIHSDGNNSPASQSLSKLSAFLMFFAAATLVFSAIGCASANLKTPPKGHVVSAIASVKQLGVGANQTGTATLGYQAAMVHSITVPIQPITDTNGVTTGFASPNAVVTYEVKGQQNNSLVGGSAGSTLTVAIGDIAVQTWAGGQHLLINTATNSPVAPAILIPVTVSTNH